jgi:hypothetical protein
MSDFKNLKISFDFGADVLIKSFSITVFAINESKSEYACYGSGSCSDNTWGIAAPYTGA